MGLVPSHPVKGDQKGGYGFVTAQFLNADFAFSEAAVCTLAVGDVFGPRYSYCLRLVVRNSIFF